MFKINLSQSTLTVYKPTRSSSSCISCGCISSSSNKRRKCGEIKRAIHSVQPSLASNLFLTKGILVKHRYSKICNFCLKKDTVDLDIPCEKIELNENTKLKDVLLVFKGLTEVLANEFFVSFRIVLKKLELPKLN